MSALKNVITRNDTDSVKVGQPARHERIPASAMQTGILRNPAEITASDYISCLIVHNGQVASGSSLLLAFGVHGNIMDGKYPINVKQEDKLIFMFSNAADIFGAPPGSHLR